VLVAGNNSPTIIEIKMESPTTITLSQIARESKGALEKVANTEDSYVLHKDLKILSTSDIELSGDLKIGEHNLTIDAPNFHFENFYVESFSTLETDNAKAKASGTLLFSWRELDFKNIKTSPKVTGKITAKLRGQNKKDAGNLYFSAYSSFNLNVEYDLRGGPLGGQSGQVIYTMTLDKNHRVLAEYAYQPEGIKSSDLSFLEI
jgi:hypothetical protein